MSLFDTLICDYPLTSLPEFSEEELEEDINSGSEGWSEWKGRMADEGHGKYALDLYTIEDDGQIYLRSTDWGEDENETGRLRPKEGELREVRKDCGNKFLSNVYRQRV